MSDNRADEALEQLEGLVLLANKAEVVQAEDIVLLDNRAQEVLCII